MRNPANNAAMVRIQWLHKKIANMYYPNAVRVAEKFQISHRQAQRDVDYLKNTLEAPLVYSSDHKGYYYSTHFSLPFVISSQNDDVLSDFIDDMSGMALDTHSKNPQIERSQVQMQIPYTATIELTDKLSILNLKPFIISKEPRNRYICEFNNTEQFLSVIMAIRADVKIIEPFWLRERLVKIAQHILKNNSF